MVKKWANVEKIIFVGKQHIPWNEVEAYLKKYVGETIVVEQYQDNIYIAYDFPEEYSESKDTKKLRGGLAKAKANAAQVIDQLIKNATKRRWRENLDPKHDKDASGGWYRYDAFFTIPVRGQDEDKERRNYYRGTVLARINPKGLYLYDVVDIKKEASTPLKSK